MIQKYEVRSKKYEVRNRGLEALRPEVKNFSCFQETPYFVLLNHTVE